MRGTRKSTKKHKSVKSQPPFQPTPKEEAEGQLYAKYGKIPLTPKQKKKKKKIPLPPMSQHKEDKFFCTRCHKVISEHKRRRHIEKRCGVKPFNLKGMRPLMLTPEMMQQLRRGQLE